MFPRTTEAWRLHVIAVVLDVARSSYCKTTEAAFDAALCKDLYGLRSQQAQIER
jgi:hypothetical protein